MKPRNIKRRIAAAICLAAFVVTPNLIAQRLPQARNVSKNQRTQFDEPQTSNENAQSQREIEMMQEMLRERRDQQDEQRRILEQLQQALNQNGVASVPSSNQESQPAYNNSNSSSQGRVTSGSALAQIEANERENMSSRQQKYELEIEIAQKEIDMLKKQLSIANTQLDQCQSNGANINFDAANYGDFSEYNDAPIQPQKQVKEKKAKKAKPQKQATKVKQQKPQKQQAKQSKKTSTPAPAVQRQSEGDAKKMREINEMREILQQRRQQQDEQMKMLKELQQSME